MIVNPYQVLEVSPNASNEEIKKAYRELSRKYHPDSYANNPLSDLAEEKFKQVQEAYQQIMKERENGTSGGAYSSQTSYQSNTDDTSSELIAVANYLNSRNYHEALNLLARIPLRSARWYNYSAVANFGVGNNMIALDHARQAVNMEPGNSEYVRILNQIQWQSQRYQTTRTNAGYGTGNLCCDLWCADTLCECMGGDLCACM